MDWDDLQYVLAVHRQHSLSGAAQQLGVTHTTVGRRLKGLEAHLGVRLFDRTPDGYVTTIAGEEIVAAAQQMEEVALTAEGRVLGRDVRLQGPLRVSTMDTLFQQHIEAFASFRTRYPLIELTVCISDDEVSLTRRDADVALRMTNTPPPYLVGRQIGHLDFAVYGLAAWVEERGEEAGYAAYPWLHWDERSNTRWLDGWLARHAPGAEIAMRVGFPSTLIRVAILAGIGVHFLPCAEGDADSRLRRIGPVVSEFRRGLWVLTLADLRNTPRVRAFMDHMAESVR
ncbi:MAG: LysR family transcriptional regulator [Bradymonadia bacterium]